MPYPSSRKTANHWSPLTFYSVETRPGERFGYCTECGNDMRIVKDDRLFHLDTRTWKQFANTRSPKDVKRVTNPRRNPTSDPQATALYKKFHGADPTEAITLDVPEIPRNMVIVGRLLAFEYEVVADESNKGGRNGKKRGQTYRHDVGDLGERKVDTVLYLCSDPSGKNFFIVRGKGGSTYPRLANRGVIG